MPASSADRPLNARLAAAVLAGGRSSRMGCDKAFLPHEGRRLIDRQIELLREIAGDELLISGRRGVDYDAPADVRVVFDPAADLGPLGGLEALLTATSAPHVLVLAVDMAAMTVARLRAIVARRRSGAGVVPKTRRGREPLAAVFPREILPRVKAHLASDDRSMQALVAAAVRAGEMVELEILPAEEIEFLSWNEPGDIRAP